MARKLVLVAAVLLAVSLVPAGAQAWYGQGSSKMTLRIKGVVGDKKTIKTLSEPLELLAWSWGVYRQTAGGPPNVQDISLTKWMGLDSPALVALANNGGAIGSVEITVEGKNTMTITLYDVFVAQLSSGGSGGEERLTENLSLHFRSYEVVIEAVDQDGKKQKSTSGRLTVPSTGPGVP